MTTKFELTKVEDIMPFIMNAVYSTDAYTYSKNLDQVLVYLYQSLASDCADIAQDLLEYLRMGDF